MSASPSVAIGRGPIAARLGAAGLDRGSIRHAVRSGRLTVVLLFLPPALLLFTLFVVLPIVRGRLVQLLQLERLRAADELRRLGATTSLSSDTRAFSLALRNNGLIILVSLLDPAAAGARAGAAAGRTVPRRGRAAHALLPALRPGRDRRRPDLALRLRRRLRPAGRDLPRRSGPTAPHLLADPRLAMAAILVVIVWKYFGFHMMLYIAGAAGHRPHRCSRPRISTARRAGRCFRRVMIPLL